MISAAIFSTFSRKIITHNNYRWFCINKLMFVGVQKILVHGSNVKSCKEALRLTRIYPGIIYSSCGIHPMDSKNVIEEPSSWIEFEEIAQQPEVVAIGPCGWDYHRDVTDSETQKEMFRRQIKLACELQKPILVHERSAQEDVMEILSRYLKIFRNFSVIDVEIPSKLMLIRFNLLTLLMDFLFCFLTVFRIPHQR
jgi:Tat protein secretion system quality control protein TatD with DNase activity